MENLPDLSEEEKAYVKCVVDMKVPILTELMQVWPSTLSTKFGASANNMSRPLPLIQVSTSPTQIKAHQAGAC
jgi:hypothetical protein